jgi:Tol biopolymer transport system component
MYPVITRDGSRVAYSIRENEKPSVYEVKIGPGGRPGLAERVCEDCGNPRGWSPDGTLILYHAAGAISAPGIHDHGIAKLGGAKTALSVQGAGTFTRPQFSPDGRWISFHRGVETASARRIFITPFRHGPPPAIAPESDWIWITDGKELDRETCWSPDGNLLYFLSERDGFRCVWAQRLDPTTKRPKGDALPVFHSHRSRLSLRNYSDSGWSGLSMALDRLVFTMSERTGNVWMMQSQ